MSDRLPMGHPGLRDCATCDGSGIMRFGRKVVMGGRCKHTETVIDLADCPECLPKYGPSVLVAGWNK